MSLELKGKIKLINPTETFGSGFTKREFVITTNEQYPQDVKFEVVKDKVALLDNFTTGQELTVHFNCRGNEYQGKYYVSLQAWKIEAQAVAPSRVATTPILNTQPAQVADLEDESTLPF